MATNKKTKQQPKKATAKKQKTEATIWPVTVFLLKDGVTTIRAALHRNAQGVDIHDVPGIGGLVLKDAPSVEPSWAANLLPLAPAVSTLRQQSPGAVLFVRVADRMFAITYGYGRSLLAAEAIVHDFGIRSVLNGAQPTLMRSIDSRTLETSPQLSRKQSVDDRPFAAFSLDRVHDLLKGVTTRVRKGVKVFASPLVTGTDSIHCRLELQRPIDLVDRCAKMLELYGEKTYQGQFGFIDHIRLVRDPATSKSLNDQLLEYAKTNAGLFNFSAPRILDGKELSLLRGSWAKKNGAKEMTPAAVRERLKVLAEKSESPEAFLERLKADRIDLLDSSNQVVDGWSLYRCLLVELAGPETHVLTTGDWYEIANSFVTAVSTRFDELVKESRANLPLSLPKHDTTTHPTEGKYNEDAAKTLKIALLDKKSLTTGQNATQVEPCDLLHATRGIFIHVKVGRSSSDLSHLFNQGLVATLTFLDDEGARDNVRKLVATKKAAPKVLREPVDPAKLTTVFAVIDKAPKKNKPWRLPFFSMLVASSVYDRIAQRGVRACIVRIEST